MGEYGDNYYSWLDRQMSAHFDSHKIGLDSFTGSLKDYLAKQLDSGAVAVQDSKPSIRDEILGKRGRGRPRKEEKTGIDKKSFAQRALTEDQRERERKLDRLNPQPTEKMKHIQEIEAGLRELGWAMEDMRNSREEIETMLMDIDSLRKEAGMKKLDDNFAPYGLFRKASIDYISKKKEFKELYDAAKECLDKKEDKRADELIASMKDTPRELKDSYKRVVEAYGDLCDSLYSVIEDKVGKNDERIGIGAIAKAGYGLLEGEDLNTYMRRMRHLGMGKSIPETIKDIDSRIKKTERQWRSVAGISIDEFERVKVNWRLSVSRMMKKCSLASNMTISEVNRLVGGGGKSKNIRKKDVGNGILKDVAGIVGDVNRIRYGIVHSLDATKKDNEIGDSYGNIVVRWKPHCVVATMTFGDSLDLERSETTFETPCLVTDASPCCFNPLKQEAVNKLKSGVIDMGTDSARKIFGIPYIELQFHGEGWYKPESIDSISFWCEDDLRNLSQSAVEQIVKNRITVYIKDEKVKIADFMGDGYDNIKEDEDEVPEELPT